MQRIKYYICLISVFAQTLVWANDSLFISLYNTSDLQKVFINPYQGSYTLITDNEVKYELQSGDWLRITKKEGAFTVETAYRDFGLNREVKVLQNNPEGLLKVLPEEPKKIEQWYGGNLIIRYGIKGVKLLNHLDLEQYVAGVVQAESGAEQNAEYYKVQGIICRTFAMANQKKHETEGFNLCDQTHCQVYHGKARAKSYIAEALKVTPGLVLVDSNLRLIDAVFHSNCGGQTLNSEDYWRGNIDYLRAKLDSLCKNMPHWSWTFAMESKEWLGYLEQKFNFPVADSVHAYNAKNWHPDTRGKWFLNPAFRIPMRTIRQDWRLRSTNFSVIEDGPNVRIIGTGFGHGVGLCQEGAMARSKEDEIYSNILHYYYDNVFVVDKSNLKFFKQF